MADFKIAFTALLKHEGGYANDPHDHGGETYRGIARRYWPGWEGWADIDRLKKGPGFPGNLAANADLQGKVRDFYSRNFWTPSLDAITNQPLADWLFDKGVNMGIRQAVKLLQRALHVDADGILGPQTMRMLNCADPVQLLAGCRDEARRFYTKLALNDPTQTRFLQGWLARA